MRCIYRGTIPLIGRTPVGHALAGTLTREDLRRFFIEYERKSRHMAVIKPERRLGGSWMADLVGQRKVVVLCDDCQRRYGNWHLAVGYNRRDIRVLTDCDGCSRVNVLCASFYSRLM